MHISQWLRGPAEEIMVRNVVTLPPDVSLADAARQFLQHQISGAPVVDDTGKCLGVLTVTDVVGAAEKVAARQAKLADEFFAHSDLVLPARVYDEQLIEVRDQLAPAAEQPVRNFMVTDLVTVLATDSIEKIVRSFIDAHVHRVLVTDADGKLRGIITTIDVLAAILRVPN